MNKINLENRVAIVTGGAQGFGLAITVSVLTIICPLFFPNFFSKQEHHCAYKNANKNGDFKSGIHGFILTFERRPKQKCKQLYSY